MPRSSTFEPTRDAPPTAGEGLGLSQLAGLLRRLLITLGRTPAAP